MATTRRGSHDHRVSRGPDARKIAVSEKRDGGVNDKPSRQGALAPGGAYAGPSSGTGRKHGAGEKLSSEQRVRGDEVVDARAGRKADSVSQERTEPVHVDAYGERAYRIRSAEMMAVRESQPTGDASRGPQSTRVVSSAIERYLSHDETRDPFDPNAHDLLGTWSAGARAVYCVNAYPNGITLSVHTNHLAAGEDGRPAAAASVAERSRSESLPISTGQTSTGYDFEAADGGQEGSQGALARLITQQFHLRFRDTRDYHLPAGRYFLHRENYAAALEGHLSQLHKSSQLADTVFYFGTSTDAFLSLHKKFDVTMRCIDLLERFTPGLTVFQTRSPMIISVLPALKHLGEKAVVSIPIETISERAVQRYMPGKPRIGERLVAAEGLRRQGIRVDLQVSPILPYGDPKRDAWDFAEVLERHADYVTFGCLATGVPDEEKQLKALPIAQRLAADEQFFWLRPYCYQYVFQALRSLCPEKLQLPVRRTSAPSQLGLFAA